MLILRVIALAFGVLAITRIRELLSLASVVLILGFLLGAAPAIGYNIVYPNATYQPVSSQNREPAQRRPAQRRHRSILLSFRERVMLCSS